MTAIGICVAVLSSTLLVDRGSGLGDVSYDQIAKSIVLIDAGNSIGTGFFVSSTDRRSIILTAQHVIGTKKSVKVYARAGYRASFVATVVVVDRDRDLALLSVPSGPFPTLTIASSVSTGESVAAGGFDNLAYRYFQSSGDLQPDFHPGSVSSIRGAFVVNDVPTDAGNSGGPLFAIDSGEVVGVVKGSFNENYYAAVGPSSISRFLRDAGVATTTPQVAVRRPAALPTSQATATPVATALLSTEVVSGLSGEHMIREQGIDQTVTTTVELVECTFSVSYHDVFQAGHWDFSWTGNLADIDPASFSVSAGLSPEPAAGDPAQLTWGWKFAFSTREGAAVFGYQGYSINAFDARTKVIISVGTDPSSLITPFRALILQCSQPSR